MTHKKEKGQRRPWIKGVGLFKRTGLSQPAVIAVCDGRSRFFDLRLIVFLEYGPCRNRIDGPDRLSDGRMLGSFYLCHSFLAYSIHSNEF
jgi:hypothetical protein